MKGVRRLLRTYSAVLDVILERKLVAVVRCDSPEELSPIAHALLEGGINTVEVTMTVPGAIGGLRRVTAEVGDRALIGAGTVLDRRSAEQAIKAGASFVVSPCCIPEVIQAAIDNGALAIPGCFTPTEVFTAVRLGAPMVKLFPASVLGPQFIREMAGPFPGLRTIPTGGITLENIGEFVAAGAAAFGLGSRLIDKAAISVGDYQSVTRNALMFREALGLLVSDLEQAMLDE